MSNYGLQLRGKPSQQKKQPSKPLLPPPMGFSLDDDDDDVESEISHQASKNKARREIEEQQKKALEEDPSVFDYDGFYDEMKEKSFHSIVQARVDTLPKYIQKLIQKPEEQKREHDIIYERKLAKERSKEDHLYVDKDKFVTSAYKKKLAEQQMWEKQQALRDLRDERDDVTKKMDLSDFYFNLQKNVAFGSREKELRNLDKKAEPRKQEKEEEQDVADKHEKEHPSAYSNLGFQSSRAKEEHRAETSTSRRSINSSDSNPTFKRGVSDNSDQENCSDEHPSADQPKYDHHKIGKDAVAAAKERFLARKRAKQQ